MKNIKIIINVFALVLLLASCKKDELDFIGDNTTATGVGSYPISNNTLQDVTANPVVTLGTSSSAATKESAGYSFKTELTYFSNSTVKEIDLYNTIGSGTRTLVSSTPYDSAFSMKKRLDTMLVSYTVPSATTGTVVKLEYVILNENTLSATRTVYLKLK